MTTFIAVVAFLLNSLLPQNAVFFGQNVNGSSGSGTFALVQKCADFASGTTTSSCTLGSTVAGHPIIVTVQIRVSTAGTISVSDSVNTYTAVGPCQNGSNLTELFYTRSGVGGSLTVQSSFSGTTLRIYESAREYSSTTSVSSTVAAACTTSPSSTSAPTSDSVTATGANNLLIGTMMDFNASSGGCGTGWGNCSSNTDQANMIGETEDKLNQASGSYSAAFTLGSAQSDWMAELAIFKD